MKQSIMMHLMVLGNWTLKIPTSSDLLVPERQYGESGMPVKFGWWPRRKKICFPGHLPLPPAFLASPLRITYSRPWEAPKVLKLSTQWLCRNKLLDRDEGNPFSQVTVKVASVQVLKFLKTLSRWQSQNSRVSRWWGLATRLTMKLKKGRAQVARSEPQK